MLWRVRTTLEDRPGALAELARRCGEEGANILALQIFPGVGGVTDELVLSAPAGWALHDVASLIESAGGRQVSVGRCTEQSLMDGPTRYLTALRQVLHRADTVEAALARLLDAEPAPPGPAPLHDRLEVTVGAQRVAVHRTAPFTATEHARATAFACLVDEVVDEVVDEPAACPPTGVGGPSGGVDVRLAGLEDTAGLIEMQGRCTPASVHAHYRAPLLKLDLRMARRLLVGGAGALVASVDGMLVGFASVDEVVDGRCELSVLVEDSWQRQRIGARLLALAARRAADLGAVEVTLRAPVDSEAAVPLVSAAGLRARVRRSGDELLISASTRAITPLGPAAPRPEPVVVPSSTPAGS